MSDAPAKGHAQAQEPAKTEAKDRAQEPALQEEMGLATESTMMGFLLDDRPSDTALERHVSLLGDPRLSFSPNAVQRAAITDQLQRRYGNSYVNQVVSLARERNASPQVGVHSLMAVHETGGAPGLIVQRDLEDELSAPMPAPSSPDRRRAIQERRERMEEYVRSLEPGEARGLLQRLRRRRPGDRLSELFHDRLSGGLRSSLLRILEEVASSPEPEAEAPEGAGAEAPGTAGERGAGEEEPAAEEGERAAGPAAAPGARGMPDIRYPLNLNRMRFSTGPIPYGPITITPSIRLSGTLVARPTDSALPRIARLNLRNRQMDMAQSFGNAWGGAGYNLSSSGLSVSVFDRQCNMRMTVSGNKIEFSTPADTISSTQGDWRFEGSMGMVLSLEIGGNPAVVEAVLTAIAVVTTVAALIAAMARWGVQLAEAIGPLFEGLAAGATRFVPIIVVEPVIRGYMEEVEERERQRRGLSPMIT